MEVPFGCNTHQKHRANICSLNLSQFLIWYQSTGFQPSIFFQHIFSADCISSVSLFRPSLKYSFHHTRAFVSSGRFQRHQFQPNMTLHALSRATSVNGASPASAFRLTRAPRVLHTVPCERAPRTTLLTCAACFWRQHTSALSATVHCLACFANVRRALSC